MTQSIFHSLRNWKKICCKWLIFHFKQQVSSQGKFYFYVNLISSLNHFKYAWNHYQVSATLLWFPIIIAIYFTFFTTSIKNANHISLLPLQMAWFVVKTKMKRRWLFALPGNPQDFKTLQLVKVNKLDFVCVNKIRNCYW